MVALKQIARDGGFAGPGRRGKHKHQPAAANACRNQSRDHPLLQILHLFAKLIHNRFQLEADGGHGRGIGL